MDINKSFIKIPNQFFSEIKDNKGVGLEYTIFNQISTEGFTIWCYLIMEQGNQSIAQTNIKRMIALFNRNKGTSKKSATNGLCDPRTIKKYLNALQEMKMIKICEEGSNKNTINFTKIRSDQELLLHVNECCFNGKGFGFQTISTELFINNIYKMGHIGWSIYCMLYKYHNLEYGGIGCQGFANCSEEYIAEVINRNKSTVSEYVNNMPKGLMTVEPQPMRTYFNPVKGIDEKLHQTNHYTINAKGDSSNKYYIASKRRKKKLIIDET